MKKNVIGHGAASILLVFTVLCMTVFAVISLTQALSDKALSDAAARMSTGYYNADTLAERVLLSLSKSELNAGVMNVLEVEVTITENEEGYKGASYAIPITDSKELFVETSYTDNGYNILTWKMQDSGSWEDGVDRGQPLFMGF